MSKKTLAAVSIFPVAMLMGYLFSGNPDVKHPKNPPEATYADNRYTEVANRLAENNELIKSEYQKFRGAAHLSGYDTVYMENFPWGNDVKLANLNDDQYDEVASGTCIGEPCKMMISRFNGEGYDQIAYNIARIGSGKTNSYRDLYGVQKPGKIDVIIKYSWNIENNKYKEEMRFIRPQQADTDSMATMVTGILTSGVRNQEMQQKLSNLGVNFGTSSVLNGLVTATVGSSDNMPTGIDFKKYLEVYSKETGKAFATDYKGSPEDLANILFNGSINYGLLGNDPRLIGLVLLGKGIEDATGNDAWSKHLNRIVASHGSMSGPVVQFRQYHDGRNPTKREYEQAMRTNSMSYNPLTDRAPENRYPTTRTYSDPVSGSSSQTNTYNPHLSQQRQREIQMQNSVGQRNQEINTRAQQNINRARSDAERGVREIQRGGAEAAAAIQRMMQDQMQRNQERRRNNQ